MQEMIAALDATQHQLDDKSKAALDAEAQLQHNQVGTGGQPVCVSRPPFHLFPAASTEAIGNPQVSGMGLCPPHILTTALPPHPLPLAPPWLAGCRARWT